MAGENDGFNGSTISFASADQTPLRDISYDETCAEVNVSGAADTEETYECGLKSRTFTCQIVGTSTITVGTKGTVAIAWEDGATDSIDNCACFGNTRSGSMDGEILTDLRFRPSVAVPA